MQQLLNCVSEPKQLYSCCEVPYSNVYSDCVRACLNNRLINLAGELVPEYRSQLLLGYAECADPIKLLGELNHLVALLMMAFDERVRTIASTGEDPGVAFYYDSYELACIKEHFSKRWQIDVTPWFLDAGLYNDPLEVPPNAVLPQLPLPYDVPCGDLAPGAPTPPAEPPQPDPCAIPVNIFVGEVVDAAYEPFADPTIAYFVATNVNGLSGGWADAVGQTVYNGVPFTPSEGMVIASDASDFGTYWIIGTTGPIQMFPRVIFEYNQIIMSWVYYLEGMSGFTDGTLAQIYQVCFGFDFPVTAPTPAGQLLLPIALPLFCLPPNLGSKVIYQKDGCSYLVNGVVREFTTTGDVDTDFVPGGLNNYVQVMRMQPDGKIIVGGAFTYYGSTPANRITRLNPDGTLDTTFNTTVGSGLNGIVLGVELDNYGNILVCGFFSTFNGSPAWRIVRLFPDGTHDTSFNTGTGFAGSYVQDMQVMPDDTILCGGLFSNYNGTAANNIAALMHDGSVDTNWNFGTGFDWFVQEITLDSVGQPIITGAFLNYNGSPKRSLVRLNFDGSIDPSFSTNLGTSFLTWFGSDIAIMQDGRIVIVGQFTSFNGVSAPQVLMLNYDGTVDTAFQANLGAGFGQTYQDVLVLPNNQLMITGHMMCCPTGSSGPNRVIRLNSDGTRDTSFTVGLGPNSWAHDLLLDPSNGSLIVAGNFTIFDTEVRLRVARIN